MLQSHSSKHWESECAISHKEFAQPYFHFDNVRVIYSSLEATNNLGQLTPDQSGAYDNPVCPLTQTEPAIGTIIKRMIEIVYH